MSGYLRRISVLAGVACTFVLASCASAPTDQEPAGTVPETSVGETTTVAHVQVGDLETLDGALGVGEEINVLIDTEGVDWRVTNSDPAVLDVVDAREGARMVRIIGLAAGESTVSFVGDTAGASDEIVVNVSER